MRYGRYLHVRTTGPPDDVLRQALAAVAGRGYLLEQASTHQDALFASAKHPAQPAWLLSTLGIGALIVLGTGIMGLLAMSAALHSGRGPIQPTAGGHPDAREGRARMPQASFRRIKHFR